MSRAIGIALSAYERAKTAAELEREVKRAESTAYAMERERTAAEVLEFAKPTLEEWFPGVEWRIIDSSSSPGGAKGYGSGHNPVIVEQPSPPTSPLKLMLSRRMLDMNEPDAGYRLIVYFVTVGRDTETGYDYWSHAEVKGPADIGRHLEAMERSRS